MDPLSSKKPNKTPQAFLGENSSLVNLDNLIKPVTNNTTGQPSAYNPFSETTIPQKNNMFLQNQPVSFWKGFFKDFLIFFFIRAS